ncbi:hypothetical protein ABPG77_010636 [Micractinium sp. CCAP 211/92]
MGSKEDKQRKILLGLAAVLGLDGSADDPLAVLKATAETLGCTVADDGTTQLADDPEPAGTRGTKRRRRRSSGAAEEGPAGAADEAAEEGDEEEDESEGGEEEEDDDDASHSSDGEPEEAEGGDEEMEDFDLTVEPVRIEDPRTPSMVVGSTDIDDGEGMLQWLISPVDTETFYEAIHEDAPLLIERKENRAYFDGLFSKDEIDRLLKTGNMQYQFNVDVTSFSAAGRKRVNYNFNGDAEQAEEAAPEMADAAVVWRRFDEGCSVRILHPQRFCDPLWHLVARLESFLQCPVGCNSYLTPAGTQGFAPHWDDIDAFVLQLEGQKRWRLYGPTDPEHVLPRFSSRDFADDELGECVLDVVLQPGDTLYMPRGTVHQAESLPDSHSLHITISANQQRSWAVFLEEALPQALRLAAQASRDLRRSLPREYFEYMGVAHEKEVEEPEDEDDEGEGQSGHEDPRREAFTAQCAELIETIMHHMPLDQVADQLAVQFLQQRMPPPPLKGAPASKPAGPPAKGTWVQLAQPGIARLVIDTEGPEPIAEVHHCMANRRDLHAKKPTDEQEALEEDLEAVAVEAASTIEFPIECAELVDILLSAGSGEPGAPPAVQVGELPQPEAGCDVAPEAVVQALLEAGVLAVVDPQQLELGPAGDDAAA